MRPTLFGFCETHPSAFEVGFVTLSCLSVVLSLVLPIVFIGLIRSYLAAERRFRTDRRDTEAQLAELKYFCSRVLTLIKTNSGIVQSESDEVRSE